LGITIREVTSDLAQSVNLENVSGAYIASISPDVLLQMADLRKEM